MAIHQPGSRKPMAEINMVPFIDVMLVLLIIFMITTPLLTEGVVVSLPKTKAKTLDHLQKEPIIVTVNAAGDFYLNVAEKPKQAITAQTLAHLAQEQLRNMSATEQRPVLVRGDKSVHYGKIMEAMVILQQAGAKSVGLITEPSQTRL